MTEDMKAQLKAEKAQFETDMEYEAWTIILENCLDMYGGIVIPSGCTTIPVPPKDLAMTRMHVKHIATGKKINIFEDCFGLIGQYSEFEGNAPYWQVESEGYDTQKFFTNEVDLVSARLQELVDAFVADATLPPSQ